ncbi:hypothetical protein ACH4C6_32715 [Streptomyces sp. NPDC017943]|uniref:hypothetical protein n=1 Tax=Streptomyces sp. NPDC017943 TaxID=3365019 RepID=UPI00379C98B2
MATFLDTQSDARRFAALLDGFDTLAAAITDGSVTIAVEGYADRWVRLVALNSAGLTSTLSVAVLGKARQAVGQDLLDGIVSEVKLAENAVTQAKVALGVVGPAALANGAVLEERAKPRLRPLPDVAGEPMEGRTVFGVRVPLPIYGVQRQPPPFRQVAHEVNSPVAASGRLLVRAI